MEEFDFIQKEDIDDLQVNTGATTPVFLNEEERNSFYTKSGASEISESSAIIEEGTCSQIGIINKRGKIESVYMHYDGYPDHMLPVIKKSYMNVGAVKNILKKGGASYLKPKFSEIEFYGDKVTMKGDAKDVAKYIKNAEYDGGAEYVYLYDERDGKWYMADTYAEPRELKPAFEHLVINEKFVPSKGNVKDAKKVAKTLEGIMIEGSALTGDVTTHLGAIKYLLMEALQDANFHSYIEPVGKALGGKIRTVMIKVDNLGGMELPVGAKTIKRFLDDNYVKISSAAGWSGIGIVEGIALYLDGWGLSKHAQKIVDAFNLIYQNEAIVNEGNAFFSARAKAMEEGADEFEFNGKTFPLTKEEEEVEEGNAFGAARAEAIAKGDDKFKVGDEEYDVEGVDADDKENAEEYAEEEGIEVKEEEVTEEEDEEFHTEAEEVTEEEDEEFHTEAEEVTEAKFVKDFDKDVLDAETKADITTYYPSAKFFIGKMTHFFGELEPNLFFKAYYAKYYKEDTGKKIDGDFKITSIYSEKGSRYVHLFNESAQPTNEAEVKSDEDFKEYAFAVLGKAFGDDFDEAKAQEVVDGLLSKHGEDYGAAVGALTASLG